MTSRPPRIVGGYSQVDHEGVDVVDAVEAVRRITSIPPRRASVAPASQERARSSMVAAPAPPALPHDLAPATPLPLPLPATDEPAPAAAVGAAPPASDLASALFGDLAAATAHLDPFDALASEERTPTISKFPAPPPLVSGQPGEAGEDEITSPGTRRQPFGF